MDNFTCPEDYFDNQYCLPEQVPTFFRDTNQGYFSVFHLNVRSFNRNCDELTVLLDQFVVRPDVIVLTETWFSTSNCNADLPGYCAQHVYRTDRRGGGVSVFTKRNYKSCLVSEQSYIGENLEICSINVAVSNKQLIIHGVYRPPDRDVNIFTDEILEIIGHNVRDKHVLMIGDFNIDLMQPTTAGTEFINMCYASSFVPLIGVPTHISPAGSSCIDHAWYNHCSGARAHVIKADISDHYPMLVALPLRTDVNDLYLKQFRDHSQTSLNRFREELRLYVPVIYRALDSCDADVNSMMQVF